MTMNNLEYYILVDKTTVELRGLTSVLKKFLLWVKSYQKALHATEKSFGMKSQLILQTSLLSYFKKLPPPPPAFSNHHPDQPVAINNEERPPVSEKIMTHSRLR